MIKYILSLVFITSSLFSINPIKQAIINYDPASLQMLLEKEPISKKEVKEYFHLIHDMITDFAKKDIDRNYWPPMTTLESVLMGSSLIVGLSSAAAIFYYGLYKNDQNKTAYSVGIFSANLLFTIITAILYDIQNKNILLEMHELLENR